MVLYEYIFFRLNNLIHERIYIRSMQHFSFLKLLKFCKIVAEKNVDYHFRKTNEEKLHERINLEIKDI